MPSESTLRVVMFILVYACVVAPFFLSGIGLVKIKDGFKQDNNKKIKGGAAYIVLSFALFQFYLIEREIWMKFLFSYLLLGISVLCFSNQKLDNFLDNPAAVYYANSIAQSIQSSNFVEAELYLDQWESEQGHIFPGTILGLRSTLLMIYGEFDTSVLMMEKAFPLLAEEGHEEQFLNCVKSVYNSQIFQDMLDSVVTRGAIKERLMEKSSRRLMQEAQIGLSKEDNDEIFSRRRSRIDHLVTTLSRRAETIKCLS